MMKKKQKRTEKTTKKKKRFEFENTLLSTKQMFIGLIAQ